MHKCVCGREYPKKLKLPIHCPCGNKIVDPNSPKPKKLEIPKGGVGTELKKILAKLGIRASEDCSCNRRSQYMDEQGIQWCKDNLETIVGWIEEEAQKRDLPFTRFVGRRLVKRAIRNAEKAES